MFFCQLLQFECNLHQVWWSPKIWEHDLVLRWVLFLCVYILSILAPPLGPGSFGPWWTQLSWARGDRSADAKSSLLSTPTCYCHDAETKNWFSFILLNGSWGDEWPAGHAPSNFKWWFCSGVYQDTFAANVKLICSNKTYKQEVLVDAFCSLTPRPPPLGCRARL